MFLVGPFIGVVAAAWRTVLRSFGYERVETATVKPTHDVTPALDEPTVTSGEPAASPGT